MAALKVIIIGSGLAGLSTAIALRKYCDISDLDIIIYEKPGRKFDIDKMDQSRREAELGAGVSLQSNGLRVLSDLHPELGEKVSASGFPCDHFKWKTAGNFMLGREPVNALPISRPILIDCLMHYLPSSIFLYKCVAEVITEAGKKPIIRFEDGSPDETADIVIGADGVGSIVRRSLFPGDQYKAEFQGRCAVGGILSDESLPQDLIDDKCIKFFLGSTGAFGYTRLSQSDCKTLMYFSIYETELPDRGQQIDKSLMLRELRDRHGNWTDSTITKCLGKNQIVENVYPIFVVPEMPQWGRNGCILIGDAAHALPPASGQGSSQALEDGQTLGLLLARYLDAHDTAIAVDKSISALYEIRSPRVYKIRAWAMAWKDPKTPMSIIQTLALYAFLFMFVRIRYVASLFESVDSWDAKVEVDEHLKQG